MVIIAINFIIAVYIIGRARSFGFVIFIIIESFERNLKHINAFFKSSYFIKVEYINYYMVYLGIIVVSL